MKDNGFAALLLALAAQAASDSSSDSSASELQSVTSPDSNSELQFEALDSYNRLQDAISDTQDRLTDVLVWLANEDDDDTLDALISLKAGLEQTLVGYRQLEDVILKPTE